MSVPFIAVEGPIGVGKTSFTEAIARTLHYTALHEIVDENPFLNKFYDDIEEWSFQTEMFFLCNRYKQLRDLERDVLSKSSPVVADYHIMKNLIFARRTLLAEEYAKYEDIYTILTRDVPMPNFIIYVTASLSTLQRRIAKRGRTFEAAIDDAYLRQLIEDYELAFQQFEKQYPHIPILRFHGDEWDIVHERSDEQKMIATVQREVERWMNQ